MVSYAGLTKVAFFVSASITQKISWMLSAIWWNSCSLSSKTVLAWRSVLCIWRKTPASKRAKTNKELINEISSARATRGD